ncbi:hypothetical protein KPATCC21470_7997 [Kitasatospora purpeofusca]
MTSSPFAASMAIGTVRRLWEWPVRSPARVWRTVLMPAGVASKRASAMVRPCRSTTARSFWRVDQSIPAVYAVAMPSPRIVEGGLPPPDPDEPRWSQHSSGRSARGRRPALVAHALATSWTIGRRKPISQTCSKGVAPPPAVMALAPC